MTASRSIPNSRYHLIETGFYRGNAENREELLARTAMESEFLRRYPEFSNELFVK